MVCSNGATIHCVHYLNVSFEVRHSIKRRQSDCLVCTRYHGSLVIRFRYDERMTRKWYAKRIRIVVGLKSSFCVHHLSHNRREWENNKGFELKSFAMWVVVVPTHGSHLHWTCAQWRVNICEHTTNELQQIYRYIYIFDRKWTRIELEGRMAQCISPFEIHCPCLWISVSITFLHRHLSEFYFLLFFSILHNSSSDNECSENSQPSQIYR